MSVKFFTPTKRVHVAGKKIRTKDEDVLVVRLTKEFKEALRKHSLKMSSCRFHYRGSSAHVLKQGGARLLIEDGADPDWVKSICY
jgi:hypothetical protein